MHWEIANWNALFENAQSRKYDRLAWVPTPNSFDGEKFSRLMRRERGVEIYGAWRLIVEVASRCPIRGKLVKSNDVPHDFESLAIVTRAPEEVFRVAVPVLLEMGWLLELGAASHSAPTAATATDSSALPASSQRAPSALPPDSDRAIPRARAEMKERTEQKEHNARARGDLVAIAEFQKLVDALGGKLGWQSKRHWSQQETYYAGEHCPITQEQWDLVEWFYSLPNPNNEFELSRRYGDRCGFVTNFDKTLDRAGVYAKKMGRGGGAAELAKKIPPAPADYPERFARLYGAEAVIPDWSELDAGVRREVLAA